MRNSGDLGEVIIPAVYEDGLPAEKRGTTITLTGLKADAVRFSVETISNTIRDAFWGIEPSELRIKINGTEVAPEEPRSEEHTSELQSLMRISYAVFCLKKKNKYRIQIYKTIQQYNRQQQDITDKHK